MPAFDCVGLPVFDIRVASKNEILLTIRSAARALCTGLMPGVTRAIGIVRHDNIFPTGEKPKPRRLQAV
jgi:hypothetical protein